MKTDNKTIAQFGLASLVSIIFECNRNDFLTAIILVFISIRTLFLRWDIPDGNQGEYTMCNEIFSFENTLIKQSLKRRIMRDCFALNIYKARGNIFTSPLKVLYEGGECTRYALDQAALLAERHSNQQLIQGSALQLGRLLATWWCMPIILFSLIGIKEDNFFKYIFLCTTITYVIGSWGFAEAGISINLWICINPKV